MDLSFLQMKSINMLEFWGASFNPCSYGSFVLTLGHAGVISTNQAVSILVLMDLSFLQEEAAYEVRLGSRVSILVLMDLSFLRI